MSSYVCPSSLLPVLVMLTRKLSDSLCENMLMGYVLTHNAHFYDSMNEFTLNIILYLMAF